MKHGSNTIVAGLGLAAALTLAPGAPAQSPYRAFGIEHEDIGLASHTINSDGTLTIMNIGSSGKDGVRVHQTMADGHRVSFASALPASSEPTGTMFALLIEGATSGPMGSVSATDVGDVYDYAADFSPLGSTGHTLAVIDAARRAVLEAPGHTGGFSAPVHPQHVLARALPGGNLQVRFRWDAPTTVNVPGHGTFEAVMIDMRSTSSAPAASRRPTEELYGNYHFLLEVGGTPTRTIIGETLLHERAEHGALGGAWLGVDAALGLTVTNIGSSGLDGVAVIPFRLADSTADPADVQIEFRAPIGINVAGTQLIANARGRASWMMPPIIATMSAGFSSSGGPATLSTDFSELGATQVRLIVLNDGAVVSDTVLADGGAIATIEAAVAGDPGLVRLDATASTLPVAVGNDPPTIGFAFDRDAQVTPLGFVPEIGDEVLVAAVDPGGPVDNIVRLEVTGADLGPVSVLDESVAWRLHFGGLPHSSLGDADFHDEDSDGDGLADRIEITNIGSSGEDGVSIDLGPAGGWSGELDFGKAGALAPGTSARFAITTNPFVVGNDPPEAAAVITEDGGTGGARIALDYPAEPGDSLHVQLIDDGVVVDEVTHPHPFPDPLVVGNIGSSGKDGVSTYLRHRERAVTPARLGTAATDLQETEFLFVMPADASLSATNGSGNVAGDAVRLVLVAPGETYDPGDPIEIKFTAGSFDRATVSGAEIIAHELTHTGQGGAHLIGVEDVDRDGRPDIVVSNIGSSGLDGVSIDLNDDWSAKAMRSHGGLYKIEHAGPPGVHDNPECLIWDIKGSTDGSAPGERIMQPEFGTSSGAWDVSLAPVPWAAPETVTVEVFEFGSPVASVSGLAPGVVATVDTLEVPGVYEWTLLAAGDATSQGIPATGAMNRFVWDAPVLMTLPGQPPVTGDELRITAETAPTRRAGATLPHVSAQTVDFLMTAPASAAGAALAITGETVDLIDPCPTDIDSNGAVDIEDLLDTLAAWGPCPAPPAACPEDTNGDDTVDIEDLLVLLAAWGACP